MHALYVFCFLFLIDVFATFEPINGTCQNCFFFSFRRKTTHLTLYIMRPDPVLRLLAYDSMKG